MIDEERSNDKWQNEQIIFKISYTTYEYIVTYPLTLCLVVVGPRTQTNAGSGK